MELIDREQQALETLAEGLRRKRRAHGDRQADADARLGVSRQTYRQLERGSPRQPLALWVRAARPYGDLDGLAAIFPQSLFDDYPVLRRERFETPVWRGARSGGRRRRSRHWVEPAGASTHRHSEPPFDHRGPRSRQSGDATLQAGCQLRKSPLGSNLMPTVRGQE
jgi:DNA-binding XRE family transcriptional regulator